MANDEQHQSTSGYANQSNALASKLTNDVASGAFIMIASTTQ